MRLQFIGANRQVTGSRYCLDAGGLKLLIDCGMFQERPFLDRNWAPSPVPPSDIDFLLLTHAHLDHCGLIPRLVQQGFRGPILATRATIELTRIVLADAAKIQEEDAQTKMRRHQREGRRGRYPEIPLYTAEDAARTFAMFREVSFDQPIALNDQVTATFQLAGHILGSASIAVTCRENGAAQTIIFSGDLGQSNRPLLHDPAPLPAAQYIVMESTYGTSLHDDASKAESELARIINETVDRGGNVLIPTFAIDRPQELVFYLHRLLTSQRIPPILAFLDSPMAVSVHDVFLTHMHELDEQTQAAIRAGEDPLDFPGFKLTRSVEDSKAINNVTGTCIIMAGAGMCTGGRIKHHLVHNISRAQSTIVFCGYQARGTLGREILSGAKTVRIFGKQLAVDARVEQISGLSAHGDRNDLVHWLKTAGKPPRQLFLTHGEEDVALSLAAHIRAQLKWNVDVPAYGTVADLTAHAH